MLWRYKLHTWHIIKLKENEVSIVRTGQKLCSLSWRYFCFYMTSQTNGRFAEAIERSTASKCIVIWRHVLPFPLAFGSRLFGPWQWFKNICTSPAVIQHSIFSLARDLVYYIQYPSNVQKIARVAKTICRIINTMISVWLDCSQISSRQVSQAAWRIAFSRQPEQAVKFCFFWRLTKHLLIQCVPFLSFLYFFI